MSKQFSQIRSRLGLDDILTFGKYQGRTVLEVLEENPKYIQWLIVDAKKPVYLSVLEETARRLDLLDNKPSAEDFPEVYFDDVPF